ncbi:MAG: hypothetical protein ACTSR8_12220 [Promethearchaeota archaeon]
MVNIPIISISINESLKNFITKLVSKNKYENKSKLIRDALLRLMSAEELGDIGQIGIGDVFSPITKKIIGNMIIVAPNDPTVLKKINKVEDAYKAEIMSKNVAFYSKNLSIFMVFEGNLDVFQKIVVDLNSIKEIKNFRYLIVN